MIKFFSAIVGYYCSVIQYISSKLHVDKILDNRTAILDNIPLEEACISTCLPYESSWMRNFLFVLSAG